MTVATKIGGRLGDSLCFKVHRLVAEAFLAPPPEEYLTQTISGSVIVNHKDGNKANNCVTNLEWSTPSLNAQHAVDMGLVKFRKGLDSPHFHLTAEQVIYIQSIYISGHREFGGRALSVKLGVGRRSIATSLTIDITD